MDTALLAAVARVGPGLLAIPLAAAGGPRVESTAGPEATMHITPIDIDTVARMQTERIGHGPPVVLVGGGLTGWASWEPHAQRLAATRQVIRLQLLNVQYGLENRPLPDGYSIRAESRALAAALDVALDAHETVPVDLAAWSYGALVALDFALDHPERVRTLTLIEPPALWTLPDHGSGLPDVQNLEALSRVVEGGDVSIDALVTFLNTVALVPPGKEPDSLPQWESWVRHRRSLRANTAPFAHSDDPARLGDFPRPVLLVTGEGTSPFLRAVHDTLAATLPRARVLELPGGHAPHLVAMDRFLEALAGFQEEASDGAAGRELVTSRDGTPIAYWRSGSGPALLLVHGATADHTTTWRLVREELEQRFTVYAMDRRGRGGSGDAPDYTPRLEAEDVAAVADAIGGPVAVLGHSYGALAALEAARITPNIDRLILYEGVPMRGEDGHPAGLEERIAALLDAGDMEGILVTMYRDLVGMSPAEIELLRGQRDAWARRLANASTLPRELTGERDYVFRPARFASMRAPTLLLVGEDSPPRELRNARGVAAGLPDARVVVMPGQQHAAMYTSPGAFVAEVFRFLEATRRLEA
jgi:pimeloyl-ACP methyl ester carboxylesterase